MAFVTLLNAIFVALCLMISMSYCHACSYRYNCDAHRDRSAVNRTFDGLFISSTVQQYEEQNNEGYFIEPLLLDLDTDMQRGNRAAITKWAFLRQLLAYIESYEKLVLMSDNTPVYITIEALMNSTITDACKYVKDTYDVNNLNCSNHDEFKSLLLKLELRDIIIKSFGPVFGSGVITNETPLSTYWRSHAQNATDNQEFKMNVEKYLFRSRCVNHTCDLYSS